MKVCDCFSFWCMQKHQKDEVVIVSGEGFLLNGPVLQTKITLINIDAGRRRRRSLKFCLGVQLLCLFGCIYICGTVFQSLAQLSFITVQYILITGEIVIAWLCKTSLTFNTTRRKRGSLWLFAIFVTTLKSKLILP